MTKRTLAVITARGGSKSIPSKNLALLAGKPLIEYTIAAAQASKLLTHCIVSSDGAKIIETAKKLGTDAPFVRPVELSTDTALAIPVLQHALKFMRDEKKQAFDYIMMLHPTSPLRTAADIDACITLMEQTNADSVMSMKRLSDFSPKKLKIIKDGQIFPLLEEEGTQSAPRHKGPDVYKRNCAVYLTRTDLIERGEQFGKKSMAYIMPMERSIDINEPHDLALAEFWLTYNQRA